MNTLSIFIGALSIEINKLFTGYNHPKQEIEYILEHTRFPKTQSLFPKVKKHTKIGSYSNALQSANERADFLNINIKTIRSKVADTDIGEAYMKFTKLSNSYQATLSTIAKINAMSLLNYM